VAKKVVFSYAGNPGVGLLRRMRDAIENGYPKPIETEEHSHSAMAQAYEAGASGLPCAVFRGYLGADLRKVNPNIKTVTCPFTGEELAAVPALTIRLACTSGTSCCSTIHTASPLASVCFCTGGSLRAGGADGVGGVDRSGFCAWAEAVRASTAINRMALGRRVIACPPARSITRRAYRSGDSE
jgi:hypothetical protein